MHAISFLQKRGHLCAVARGHEMFEHIDDMTPARFDLLYVIYHHYAVKLGPAVTGYWMEQAAATKKLGVSRQTVWKMVERLVELELLTKTKNTNGPNRRLNILKLTKKGVQSIRVAMTAAFTECTPLARDVLMKWKEDRSARRIALAEALTKAKPDTDEEKVGREVEKMYTSFAWKRTEGGRRGKQFRHLSLIDDTVTFMRSLADALGNNVASIYTMRFTDEHDH